MATKKIMCDKCGSLLISAATIKAHACIPEMVEKHAKFKADCDAADKAAAMKRDIENCHRAANEMANLADYVIVNKYTFRDDSEYIEFVARGRFNGNEIWATGCTVQRSKRYGNGDVRVWQPWEVSWSATTRDKAHAECALKVYAAAMQWLNDHS